MTKRGFCHGPGDRCRDWREGGCRQQAAPSLCHSTGRAGVLLAAEGAHCTSLGLSGGLPSQGHGTLQGEEGRKEGLRGSVAAWPILLSLCFQCQRTVSTYISKGDFHQKRKKKKVAALQVCKHLVLQTAI